MKDVLVLASLTLGGTIVGQGLPAPPVAARQPHAVISPYGTRQDPYLWLRDDSHKDPAVLAYLAAERTYADQLMAPAQALQNTVFDELVQRADIDNSTVPYRKGGYLYSTRYERGSRLPVELRRLDAPNAPEEILLDEPKMAASSGLLSVGSFSVSPNGRFLAWSENTSGRQRYVVKIKDLVSSEPQEEVVVNVDPHAVWADDDRTLFYVAMPDATQDGSRVLAHTRGTASLNDRLVYEETEPGFRLTVSRTADDKYICITARSQTSSEQRCTPAGSPQNFTLIAARTSGVDYQVDHARDRWIMRTNRDAPNYRLKTMTDAAFASNAGTWRDLVSPSDNYIEAFKAFDDFVAIEERADGNKRIRILLLSGAATIVPADEAAYTMMLDDDQEPNTSLVRYTYTSLVTPETLLEFDSVTGERRVLKAQRIAGYDSTHYRTERVWIPASDGARIPVSLFYRKDLSLDGTAALFQFGGGAFGRSEDPVFTSYAVSLVDRGVVFALAHVRGGGELGSAWHEAGRGLNKRNSITDFVDVTRYLVKEHYAAPTRVAAMGRSYGGLTVAAAANLAPGTYHALIAGGPFTDVTTTLLDDSDPSLRLARLEYGDPRQKDVYAYQLSYSPYDNVGAHAYPAIYVGTGLFDGPVGYYNSAKWVAKLRAVKVNHNPVLLRVSTDAARNPADRFTQQAEYLTFALTQLQPTP